MPLSFGSGALCFFAQSRPIRRRRSSGYRKPKVPIILRNEMANCNIGSRAQLRSTSVLLLRANWVCFSCVRKKDGAPEWKSQPSTLSWTIGIAGPLKPNGTTAHWSAFTLLRTMRLRHAGLPNNRNPGSRSSAFFLRHDRFGGDEIAEEFRRWVVFTSKLVRIGARATSTCFLIRRGAADICRCRPVSSSAKHKHGKRHRATPSGDRAETSSVVWSPCRAKASRR
jgi:hypothetical protein